MSAAERRSLMTPVAEGAMKVRVDMGKCVGSGMCTTIAPRVFELDDNGVLVVLKQEVAKDEAEAVSDAVACCPVGAIILGS